MKLTQKLETEIKYSTIKICKRLQMPTPMIILDRKELLKVQKKFDGNKYLSFHIRSAIGSLGYTFPHVNMVFIDVKKINRKQLKAYTKEFNRRITAKELLAQVICHELTHLRYPNLTHCDRFTQVIKAIFQSRSLKYIEGIAGTVTRYRV